MPDEVRKLIDTMDLETAKKLSEYLDSGGLDNFQDELNERINQDDPTYFG